MRFASLGSGSEGNALIVEAGRTRVMVDCGFGLRETERRLEQRGVVPSDLTAILVTHEHSDHVGGVFRLARRHSIPVYLTYGTYQASDPDKAEDVSVRMIDSHEPFAIEDLEIHPFPVPHDAHEPVQYVFSDGARRLGLLTDVGQSTPCIVRMLSGCEALVLECNHDRALLAQSSYPAFLKRRIAGDYGHLSNEAAADILAAVDRSRLQSLWCAHLSRQNNRPELARAAIAAVLGCVDAEVDVACQSEGIPWVTM